MKKSILDFISEENFNLKLESMLNMRDIPFVSFTISNTAITIELLQNVNDIKKLFIKIESITNFFESRNYNIYCDILNDNTLILTKLN